MNNTFKAIIKFIFMQSYRNQLLQKAKEGCIETVANGTCDDKKKIMILQRRNLEVGVFSDYIVFLKMIEAAVEKNCIPIIDRKTYKNIFFPAADDVNTWECFFEQPQNYTLNDIDYINMNVLMYHTPSDVLPVSIMYCQEEATIAYWRDVAKRYIRFKPDIYQHLQSNYENILKQKRVLGISVREGYIKLSEQEPGKVTGHPIQTEISELLELAEKYLTLWNCEYIYFTCQTMETKNLFEKRFGKKALSYNRERPRYCDLPEGSELKRNKDSENSFKHELDYITEMYLLSKCTSFICSENSGSEAAFIMSEGFEHFMCLSKGVY